MENRSEICWLCFPQRDSIDTIQSELALARRKFLKNRRQAVRVDKERAVKGYNGQVKGRIARRSFYWKRTAQAANGIVPLEEAFGLKEGWLVVVRDLSGNIVSRTFFDKDHAWTETRYYEPWNPSAPKVVFLPADKGAVLRQDWDQETRGFRSVVLHPAPYRSGSAEQSLLDARFGLPQLIAATTQEELCFCFPAQAARRQAAMQEIKSGSMVLMPAWEVKDGTLLDDTDDSEPAITFTSLEEYAKILPQEDLPPAPGSEARTEAFSPAAPDHDFVQPLSIEDSGPWTEEHEELFSSSPSEEAAPQPPLPPEDTEEEASAAPAEWDAAGGETLENLEKTPEQEEPLPENEPGLSEEAGQGEKTESKELAEAIQTAAEEEGAEAAERESAEKASPPREAAPSPIPGGYRGDIRNGKATGRGRMEQPGGMTSYEGEYEDGKRHGFGAYYYKDGNLCYAGSWKNDRRDGLGVSFRDSDHALHVAHWQDGQPQGLVTLFDSEGSLRYSGRIENGKKEGAGVTVNSQDGTVFVGQWSGGEPTGLGSAFDREGRLLYYGSWKDGKRHGRGTEFDQNGSVVFDGEWQEGKYYNGVLYQKLSQPEWD